MGNRPRRKGENPDDGMSITQRVDKIMSEGFDFPDVPDDTPLTGLARTQHEVAKEFGRAGFRRSEALYLTAALFSGSPGDPPNLED